MAAIGKGARIDVVIVGRGGGSVKICSTHGRSPRARSRAVRCPTISAVCREAGDIADFVLDLRAPARRRHRPNGRRTRATSAPGSISWPRVNATMLTRLHRCESRLQPWSAIRLYRRPRSSGDAWAACGGSCPCARAEVRARMAPREATSRYASPRDLRPAPAIAIRSRLIEVDRVACQLPVRKRGITLIGNSERRRTTRRSHPWKGARLRRML